MTIMTDEEALRGKKFHLKCVVAEKRRSFIDSVTGRLTEATSACLVPEACDETNRFLTAFLKADAVELVVDVTSPFSERGRVCIMKPDEFLRLYHLHVMSVNVKERLKLLHGAKVELITLPIEDPAQEESF